MLSTGVDMYSGRQEVRAGSEVFLIRDRVESFAPDGSWRELRADARQSTARARETRLTRLDVLRAGPVSEQRRAELKDEARLHDAVPGLPRVVFRDADGASLTFATALPPGVALPEIHGRPPWSRGVLDSVLRGLPQILRTLDGLHGLGRSHRALRPEVLIASRDRMWLRDAGLAATPDRAGDGPAAYRAPEPVPAGAATDVYMLAAVVYHLATGEAPGPDPLRPGLLRPGLAARLEELLLTALDPDPARRPGLAEVGRVFDDTLRTGGVVR